jgi:hypothetical protein
MASKFAPCSIGNLLGSTEDCHKTTYSRKVGKNKLAALSADDVELILRRSGLKAENDGDICFHHEMIYLRKYEFLQKACCDPFEIHPTTVRKKSLRNIDIAKANKINKLVMKDIKPGQKLCPKCSSHLGSINDSCIEDDEEYKPEDEEYKPEDEEYDPEDEERLQNLAATFTSLGVTPVKTKFAQKDRAVYAKRKAQEVQTAISDEVARRLNVDVNELQTCQKCTDLDAIIEGIKEKCSTSNMETTLKLITLAPPSWTIEKTANEFGVSKYMVNKARKLKKAKGILPDVSPVKARKLSEESKAKVIDFYNDDEVSRMCPGKKDFVSVKNSEGKRIHVQKRLLLANLRELYLHYKAKSSGEHVGYSKFCELRPRWCITVGAKGTHSVCVCEYHQNIKLLLDSVPGPKLHHKFLMENLVCNISERNCMLHRCEKCPGSASLREYLQTVFLERSIEDDDQLTFRQWTHTDGTRLITRQELACDVLEEIIQQINSLTSHSFIAKAQAAYLSEQKDSLSQGTAVVLLDFAENYSFIVQDAVQGYYWDNSQATLHPIVAYYREEDGNLRTISFCVVSDCLKHDATTVYAFVSVIIAHLKKLVPGLSLVRYFSDGAASQYKNCKNFLNLCYHEKDFGVKAEWHFFATSHGKSPCDGIGGTIKRLVARASLQATTGNYILNAKQLFSWAKANISGIEMFFVSTEEIEKFEVWLESRLHEAKTIAGTRSHHSFVPISSDSLKIRRISADVDGTSVKATSSLRAQESLCQSFTPGQYVAAAYDKAWYLGVVENVSLENEDVLINFMRTRNPGTTIHSFVWPLTRDECWIPFQHVISTVEVPLQITKGRIKQYKLDSSTIEMIEDSFKKFLHWYSC